MTREEAEVVIVQHLGTQVCNAWMSLLSHYVMEWTQYGLAKEDVHGARYRGAATHLASLLDSLQHKAAQLDTA